MGSRDEKAGIGEFARWRRSLVADSQSHLLDIVGQFQCKVCSVASPQDEREGLYFALDLCWIDTRSDTRHASALSCPSPSSRMSDCSIDVVAGTARRPGERGEGDALTHSQTGVTRT